MSLEWWHEQMTFHLRVKQVYIQNTLHLSLSELMRCLGGNMKMEEFNLSSSHLLTRSHSLAGNVSISWKQIDLCSSHLNHQLQMFDFNCWKYYINKTEEEEECMHSRSRFVCRNAYVYHLQCIFSKNWVSIGTWFWYDTIQSQKDFSHLISQTSVSGV